jgi:hypothetical protein
MKPPRARRDAEASQNRHETFTAPTPGHAINPVALSS